MNRHGVLVTGATTPLGQALCAALAADPGVANVLGVHAPNERPPVSPARALRYIGVDLTRQRETRELLSGELAREIDIVVHAPLHRDLAERGKRVFLLNVQSTRNLLSLAQELPWISRFVLRSFSDVYRIDHEEPLLFDEDHPLAVSEASAQSVRNHIESDQMTCTRIGSSHMQIAVLRCAEILARNMGSPLYDYLGSTLCLRPLGYDPMLNLLSLGDAAQGLRAAALGTAQGVFNLPGYDSLPLSELIHRAGRYNVPVPGPLLGPLYRLRALTTRTRFGYAIDRRRFHYGGMLDGRKAAAAFGYTPRHPIAFATLFEESFPVDA